MAEESFNFVLCAKVNGEFNEWLVDIFKVNYAKKMKTENLLFNI